MLYIFGGVPGSGKSTLARRLARETGALYLRIDTIEGALRDAGSPVVGPEGYVVAYGVAGDNLRLGRSVVADSVNPIEITRAAWRALAEGAGVGFIEIEVSCSDPVEHRARVESRIADQPGRHHPSWAEIRQRAYEPWEGAVIRLDTAGQGVAESMAALRRALEGRNGG